MCIYFKSVRGRAGVGGPLSTDRARQPMPRFLSFVHQANKRRQKAATNPCTALSQPGLSLPSPNMHSGSRSLTAMGSFPVSGQPMHGTEGTSPTRASTMLALLPSRTTDMIGIHDSGHPAADMPPLPGGARPLLVEVGTFLCLVYIVCQIHIV